MRQWRQKDQQPVTARLPDTQHSGCCLLSGKEGVTLPLHRHPCLAIEEEPTLNAQLAV